MCSKAQITAAQPLLASGLVVGEAEEEEEAEEGQNFEIAFRVDTSRGTNTVHRRTLEACWGGEK